MSEIDPPYLKMLHTVRIAAATQETWRHKGYGEICDKSCEGDVSHRPLAEDRGTTVEETIGE